MEIIIFMFGSTYSTLGQVPSLWFRECVSHLFIHLLLCQTFQTLLGRRYESEKVKAKVGPLILLHGLTLISDILSCWCDGVYFDPGHFVLRMSKVKNCMSLSPYNGILLFSECRMRNIFQAPFSFMTKESNKKTQVNNQLVEWGIFNN